MNVIRGTIYIGMMLSVIIKLLNIFYNRKLDKKEKEMEQRIEKIDLLEKNVSYERFQVVAKESSVLNAPERKQGDFLDFIINSISLTDTGIENRILRINCGEENE